METKSQSDTVVVGDGPVLWCPTSNSTNGEPGTLPVASTVDVVFRIGAHADVSDVVLVGDFNGWSQWAHPMTRTSAGFEVTVTFQRGRRIRYRYLIDGYRWENDWNADQYVPNEFGGDDSVRIV